MHYARIEPRLPAVQKCFDDVVALEFRGELEARQPRLGDFEDDAADLQLIAGTDDLFGDSSSGEVLSQRTPFQPLTEFLLPEGVIFRRIQVHRLVLAAMDGEVGLSVAIQV